MDSNAEQRAKVPEKSVTSGLWAKRPVGIAVNFMQFMKVLVKSVTAGFVCKEFLRYGSQCLTTKEGEGKSVAFGQFAKRFSGMDVNFAQPEKALARLVKSSLKVM